MNILVTGLCTLHWGRFEYGNIGNYYIIGPLFRNLHECFPGAKIVTTLQLTDEFCELANITKLPLDIYYGWRKEIDLKQALEEYGSALLWEKTGKIIDKTPYITTVIDMDLVIDFNGDMWGDNSETMGENRFLVELLKIRVAQLLGVKTVMFASSPGPVTNIEMLPFAQEVYCNYDGVINRESLSYDIMKESGFDVDATENAACPAFLFGKNYYPTPVDADLICRQEKIISDKTNVGFILATYSLPKGSFDEWKREDTDFEEYATLIEHIVNKKKAKVFLISHSNGFSLEPEFKRTHWRDFKMLEQLYEILANRGNIDMGFVQKVEKIYEPWEMHTLIGKLDILISGRVHGAVAGLAQNVPTLAFDYKNGPLAHKMYGFFEVIGMEKYVIKREDNNFIDAFEVIYANRACISSQLEKNNALVQKKVLSGFTKLKEIVEK